MYTQNQLNAVLESPLVVSALAERKRGLEKESLRVDANGTLSSQPHPKTLGSALCNPSITTDFSESLLEFITEPHSSIGDALSELDRIQAFTYANIDSELLWVSSMPCMLADDASIPIAQYGSSNVAKMKEAYRIGLANRYGRAMQTIAGIHFNFSLSDDFFIHLRSALGEQKELKEFKTDRYLSLIRNFHRYSWLLLYLFGASPAVCKTFLQGREHRLTELDNGTLLGEHATALRMGDLGYTSSAQDDLFVCYNKLDTYISSLYSALTTEYADFRKIGLKDENGQHKQLSTAVLQIENEYYSTIRPKRTAASGETPIKALKERGVEYIEVRCLDLNPYLASGTSEKDLQFVELFLIYCLLAGDDLLDTAGLKESRANIREVINFGRRPDLALQKNGQSVSLKEWANELLAGMESIAKQLTASGDNDLKDLLGDYKERLENPDLTPSGRIYNELKSGQVGFGEFVMRRSREAQSYYGSFDIDETALADLKQSATSSLLQQSEIEAQDKITFEQYLQNYFDQYTELDHDVVVNA